MEKVIEDIRGLPTAWWVGAPDSASSSGPIFFFIHGFPDDPESWHHQFDYFSKKYPVVAPYLRGCGPSEPARDKRRYDMDAVALDHLEILRREERRYGPDRKVVVVGHDIGGIHSYTLARL